MISLFFCSCHNSLVHTTILWFMSLFSCSFHNFLVHIASFLLISQFSSSLKFDFHTTIAFFTSDFFSFINNVQNRTICPFKDNPILSSTHHAHGGLYAKPNSTIIHLNFRVQYTCMPPNGTVLFKLQAYIQSNELSRKFGAVRLEGTHNLLETLHVKTVLI